MLKGKINRTPAYLQASTLEKERDKGGRLDTRLHSEGAVNSVKKGCILWPQFCVCYNDTARIKKKKGNKKDYACNHIVAPKTAQKYSRHSFPKNFSFLFFEEKNMTRSCHLYKVDFRGFYVGS